MTRKEVYLQLPIGVTDYIQFTQQLVKKLMKFGYYMPADYYYIFVTPGYISLFVGNIVMLQDNKIKELLLEYLV